jgi:pimeloyl-ACP methyl ester carboxylesterase
VLWTPADVDGPLPLVLVGHGGTVHKTHPLNAKIGTRIMATAPTAVASIDFPGHGDRGGAGSFDDPTFLDAVTDRDAFRDTGADWSAVLSAILDTHEVDETAIGYWGVSLGCWFGASFVATDERLAAAVLGMAGPSLPLVEERGRTLPYDLWSVVRSITTPTMFIAQWDDDIAPRDAALELFEMIGANEKRLISAPGRHIELPTDVVDTSFGFLRSYFSGRPDTSPFFS